MEAEAALREQARGCDELGSPMYADLLARLADDVAAGVLPGPGNPCGFTQPVRVLTNGSGSDEGRAMAQLVHGIAPGAELVFTTAAPETDANIAASIDALVEAGAPAVVDEHAGAADVDGERDLVGHAGHVEAVGLLVEVVLLRHVVGVEVLPDVLRLAVGVALLRVVAGVLRERELLELPVVLEVVVGVGVPVAVGLRGERPQAEAAERERVPRDVLERAEDVGQHGVEQPGPLHQAGFHSVPVGGRDDQRQRVELPRAGDGRVVLESDVGDAVVVDHRAHQRAQPVQTVPSALRDARGELLPVDPDHGANLFELTRDVTSAAGLPAYEVSNHARPGAESRHNLTYWRYGDYAGIGPGALLQEMGIPVIREASVGENLQDHLQLRCSWKVSEARTLNQLARRWWGKGMIGAEYVLRRTGPMSMAPSQLGAFARSSPDVATPDLEWHVQPLSLEAFGQPLHDFAAITASVCNARPVGEA